MCGQASNTTLRKMFRPAVVQRGRNTVASWGQPMRMGPRMSPPQMGLGPAHTLPPTVPVSLPPSHTSGLFRSWTLLRRVGKGVGGLGLGAYAIPPPPTRRIAARRKNQGHTVQFPHPTPLHTPLMGRCPPSHTREYSAIKMMMKTSRVCASKSTVRPSVTRENLRRRTRPNPRRVGESHTNTKAPVRF